MFDTKNKIFVFLFVVLFQSCSSFSLSNVKEEDQYLDLFRVKASEVQVVTTEDPQTTYDWGQWTKTQAPGSTYDWGQWTKTQAPGSRTTYDWGQWTKTQAPGSRTTYDWGQWTKTGAPGSRTTYDWGQWTPTPGPDDHSSGTTSNPDDDHNNNNGYKCAAGKYTCKGTIGLCIGLNQICDGKQDCPHRDDEDKRVCFPGFGGNKDKKKNYNSFAGTGFMFHVKNLVIKDGSDAKIFNQHSDNLALKKSEQKV